MTARRFRIDCNGEKHRVVLDTEGNVTFLDHPDAHAQATAERVLGALADDALNLTGCLLVARCLQVRSYLRPGRGAGEERHLYAALRGMAIGRRLRQR